MMNDKYQRCSPNTIFIYLKTIHPRAAQKNQLSHVRLLKREGMIQITGPGPGTDIILKMDGLAFLFEIETELRKIRL